MTRRVLLLVGLAMALASSTHAQAFGSCERGTTQRFLINADIQASVYNTGGLFFGGSTTSGDGYRIPRERMWQSPVFAASFWLGGLVDGDLRVAASRYGNYNFWPGPLENAADPPEDCSTYDQIFAVSRADIQHYYATGELVDDLRDWPFQLGAPVLDGDGDPTNYDLAGGDQPDLIGDMATWWVMNDAGNEHPAAGSTPPMGVEVRVHAFVYAPLDLAVSPVLRQTSFYRYEIVNQGDQPIEEMYATMWADPDLGGAGDDYIGADTLRHMVFVYNSDEEDSAYGIPPAFGMQVLQGPIGLANGRDDDFDGEVDEPSEMLRATAVGTTINGGPAGTQDPGTAQQYRNLMLGRWSGGTPIRAFGQGYLTNGPITTFIYPGDPVTKSFWSEVNIDNAGTAATFGNRIMLVSSGPFRLEPDSSATFLYAMPFGQGSDWLNSVAVMRGHASALQEIHATGYFETTPRPVVPEEFRPSDPLRLTLTRVHPNPSRQPEAVLTLPAEARVRAEVFDALGRQLDVLADGLLPAGETELAMPSGLPPGTYLLRVQVAPGGEKTLTFTVIR